MSRCTPKVTSVVHSTTQIRLEGPLFLQTPFQQLSFGGSFVRVFYGFSLCFPRSKSEDISRISMTLPTSNI